MDAFQGGVEVTVEALSPHAVRELVEVLTAELNAWAFQREKVLEKLDLRGARRARKAVTDLKSFVRASLEKGRVDELAVAPLLEEAHLILCGPLATDEADVPDSTPPPESLVSTVRRITRKVPAIVPMYGDDEPTLPGHRRAALVSLTAADGDEDNDKTAAGLPNDVLAKYLREVRRATG